MLPGRARQPIEAGQLGDQRLVAGIADTDIGREQALTDAPLGIGEQALDRCLEATRLGGGKGLPIVAAEYGGDVQRFAQQGADRSEEHTSELQSRENLVCRLLLEKKKTNK